MNTQIEVITSVERLRRWSAAEKERLVAALLEPGAIVSEVARAAGIHRSQLYGWRRQQGVRGQAPTGICSRSACSGGGLAGAAGRRHDRD